MKQLVVLCILLATLLLNVDSTFGQHGQYRGPQDFHGAVKLTIPHPLNYPPIRNDMPPDVLKGYRIFDSLMHVDVDQSTIDAFVPTMGNSDTLRRVLKYVYEMIDYDPSAFYQFLESFPWTGIYMNRRPSTLLGDVLSRAAHVIPDSGKFLVALTSIDAILQISVTDTFSVVDTNKPEGMDECQGVSGSISEVIKGRILPECLDTIQVPSKTKEARAFAEPRCVSFQYWTFWSMGMRDSGERLQKKGSWIMPGRECIVFLEFVGLGRDTASGIIRDFVTLSPEFPGSTVMGVYPIVDGIVYNPQNDFGFGVEPTVAEFKKKLRQKIASITSYN